MSKSHLRVVGGSGNVNTPGFPHAESQEIKPLAEKVILVRLTRHQFWNGKIIDKAATDAIHKSNAAKSDAGVYYKQIVSVKAFSDITSANSSLYTFHCENTLGYVYKGPRLLPIKNYWEYRQGIEERKQILHNAVQDFIDRWPSQAIEQMPRLGAMYNPDEYPSKEKLKQWGGVELDMFPLSDADYCPVYDGLPVEEINKIKQGAQQAANEILEMAGKEVLDRLYQPLLHAIERLSDPNGKLHESVIENIQAAMDIAPRLNIANDPRVEEIRDKLARYVTNKDIRDLKKNPVVRKEAVNRAQEIADMMKGFF